MPAPTVLFEDPVADETLRRVLAARRAGETDARLVARGALREAI